VVTRPIINTEVEYKLVKEALQQDLEDKNEKINKLESANNELRNKVNNLMAANINLHEKNSVKDKHSQDTDLHLHPQAHLNSLVSFQRNQQMVRRKYRDNKEFGTKDIFKVEEFETGNSGVRHPDSVFDQYASEKSNLGKCFYCYSWS
jgi:hypothetical protein